jgi:hypothetical protein
MQQQQCAIRSGALQDHAAFIRQTWNSKTAGLWTLVDSWWAQGPEKTCTQRLSGSWSEDLVLSFQVAFQATLALQRGILEKTVTELAKLTATDVFPCIVDTIMPLNELHMDAKAALDVLTAALLTINTALFKGGAFCIANNLTAAQCSRVDGVAMKRDTSGQASVVVHLRDTALQVCKAVTALQAKLTAVVNLSLCRRDTKLQGLLQSVQTNLTRATHICSLLSQLVLEVAGTSMSSPQHLRRWMLVQTDPWKAWNKAWLHETKTRAELETEMKATSQPQLLTNLFFAVNRADVRAAQEGMAKLNAKIKEETQTLQTQAKAKAKVEAEAQTAARAAAEKARLESLCKTRLEEIAQLPVKVDKFRADLSAAAAATGPGAIQPTQEPSIDWTNPVLAAAKKMEPKARLDHIVGAFDPQKLLNMPCVEDIMGASQTSLLGVWKAFKDKGKGLERALMYRQPLPLESSPWNVCDTFTWTHSCNTTDGGGDDDGDGDDAKAPPCAPCPDVKTPQDLEEKDKEGKRLVCELQAGTIKAKSFWKQFIAHLEAQQKSNEPFISAARVLKATGITMASMRTSFLDANKGHLLPVTAPGYGFKTIPTTAATALVATLQPRSRITTNHTLQARGFSSTVRYADLLAQWEALQKTCDAELAAKAAPAAPKAVVEDAPTLQLGGGDGIADAMADRMAAIRARKREDEAKAATQKAKKAVVQEPPRMLCSAISTPCGANLVQVLRNVDDGTASFTKGTVQPQPLLDNATLVDRLATWDVGMVVPEWSSWKPWTDKKFDSTRNGLLNPDKMCTALTTFFQSMVKITQANLRARWTLRPDPANEPLKRKLAADWLAWSNFSPKNINGPNPADMAQQLLKWQKLPSLEAQLLQLTPSIVAVSDINFKQLQANASSWCFLPVVVGLLRAMKLQTDIKKKRSSSQTADVKKTILDGVEGVEEVEGVTGWVEEKPLKKWTCPQLPDWLKASKLLNAPLASLAATTAETGMPVFRYSVPQALRQFKNDTNNPKIVEAIWRTIESSFRELFGMFTAFYELCKQAKVKTTKTKTETETETKTLFFELGNFSSGTNLKPQVIVKIVKIIRAVFKSHDANDTWFSKLDKAATLTNLNTQAPAMLKACLVVLQDNTELQAWVDNQKSKASELVDTTDKNQKIVEAAQMETTQRQEYWTSSLRALHVNQWEGHNKDSIPRNPAKQWAQAVNKIMQAELCCLRNQFRVRFGTQRWQQWQIVARKLPHMSAADQQELLTCLQQELGSLQDSSRGATWRSLELQRATGELAKLRKDNAWLWQHVGDAPSMLAAPAASLSTPFTTSVLRLVLPSNDFSGHRGALLFANLLKSKWQVLPLVLTKNPRHDYALAWPRLLSLSWTRQRLGPRALFWVPVTTPPVLPTETAQFQWQFETSVKEPWVEKQLAPAMSFHALQWWEGANGFPKHLMSSAEVNELRTLRALKLCLETTDGMLQSVAQFVQSSPVRKDRETFTTWNTRIWAKTKWDAWCAKSATPCATTPMPSLLWSANVCVHANALNKELDKNKDTWRSESSVPLTWTWKDKVASQTEALPLPYTGTAVTKVTLPGKKNEKEITDTMIDAMNTARTSDTVSLPMLASAPALAIVLGTGVWNSNVSSVFKQSLFLVQLMQDWCKHMRSVLDATVFVENQRLLPLRVTLSQAGRQVWQRVVQRNAGTVSRAKASLAASLRRIDAALSWFTAPLTFREWCTRTVMPPARRVGGKAPPQGDAAAWEAMVKAFWQKGLPSTAKLKSAEKTWTKLLAGTAVQAVLEASADKDTEWVMVQRLFVISVLDGVWAQQYEGFSSSLQKAINWVKKTHTIAPPLASQPLWTNMQSWVLVQGLRHTLQLPPYPENSIPPLQHSPTAQCVDGLLQLAMRMVNEASHFYAWDKLLLHARSQASWAQVQGAAAVLNKGIKVWWQFHHKCCAAIEKLVQANIPSTYNLTGVSMPSEQEQQQQLKTLQTTIQKKIKTKKIKTKTELHSAHLVLMLLQPRPFTFVHSKWLQVEWEMAANLQAQVFLLQLASAVEAHTPVARPPPTLRPCAPLDAIVFDANRCVSMLLWDVVQHEYRVREGEAILRLVRAAVHIHTDGHRLPPTCDAWAMTLAAEPLASAACNTLKEWMTRLEPFLFQMEAIIKDTTPPRPAKPATRKWSADVTALVYAPVSMSTTSIAHLCEWCTLMDKVADAVQIIIASESPREVGSLCPLPFQCVLKRSSSDMDAEEEVQDIANVLWMLDLADATLDRITMYVAWAWQMETQNPGCPPLPIATAHFTPLMRRVFHPGTQPIAALMYLELVDTVLGAAARLIKQGGLTMAPPPSMALNGEVGEVMDTLTVGDEAAQKVTLAGLKTALAQTAGGDAKVDLAASFRDRWPWMSWVQNPVSQSSAAVDAALKDVADIDKFLHEAYHRALVVAAM